MRISLNTNIQDRAISSNFITLRDLLNKRLSLDNFRGKMVEGVTASTPDTTKEFPHEFRQLPVGAFVILGDAYVYSVSDKFLDIRSRSAETTFKVFCIFE